MSRELITHYARTKTDIADGGTCARGVDDILDDCITAASVGGIEHDVAKFIKTFPYTGAAGVVAFIRQRWTAALVDLEIDLLLGVSK